jgi:cytochrome P450
MSPAVTAQVSELDLPFFDVVSDAYEADPHAVLDGLRASSWVVRSPLGFSVLAYEQAKDLKRSNDIVRIFDAMDPELSPMLAKMAEESISSQHGPRLVQLRRLVLQAMRPHQVAARERDLSQIMHGLLDQVEGEGEPDLVARVLEPYPGLIMGPIMGVPFAEAGQLDRWATVINELGNHSRYGLRVPAIEEAWLALESYLTDQISRKRAEATNDVLGDLVQAADADNGVDDHDLLGLAMSIVTASIDNVRSELALTFEALLDHPDQWGALREDPSLVAAAVEEGLRYVPAGDDIQHRVARDTELGGIGFAQGTLLFIVKKAVNHDPAAFEAPHRFDIRREGPAHLTFGFGLHACVGATVARSALSAGLTALNQRVSSWERLGPSKRAPMASGGRPLALPLRVTVEPRA